MKTEKELLEDKNKIEDIQKQISDLNTEIHKIYKELLTSFGYKLNECVTIEVFDGITWTLYINGVKYDNGKQKWVAVCWWKPTKKNYSVTTGMNIEFEKLNKLS